MQPSPLSQSAQGPAGGTPADMQAAELASQSSEHDAAENGESETLPYSCDVCGRGFRVHQQLAAHTRSHPAGLRNAVAAGLVPPGSRGQSATLETNQDDPQAEAMPYTCDVCGRGFRVHQHLAAHVRSHPAMVRQAAARKLAEAARQGEGSKLDRDGSDEAAEPAAEEDDRPGTAEPLSVAAGRPDTADSGEEFEEEASGKVAVVAGSTSRGGSGKRRKSGPAAGGESAPSATGSAVESRRGSNAKAGARGTPATGDDEGGSAEGEGVAVPEPKRSARSSSRAGAAAKSEVEAPSASQRSSRARGASAVEAAEAENGDETEGLAASDNLGEADVDGEEEEGADAAGAGSRSRKRTSAADDAG